MKEHNTENNLKIVLEIDIVKNHRAEIFMIKHGMNKWDEKHDSLPLGKFRADFKHMRSSLGSNAQCTKCGVKESVYVSLGKRYKGTRSIIALACGDTAEEAGISFREKNRERKTLKTGEDSSKIEGQV